MAAGRLRFWHKSNREAPLAAEDMTFKLALGGASEDNPPFSRRLWVDAAWYRRAVEGHRAPGKDH